MTTAPARILVMAGGRAAPALAQIAAAGATSQKAQVTHVDLASLSLAPFPGSSGTDAGADRLRDLVASHRGLLIVAPEVHGAPAPVLANALAWLAHGQKKPLQDKAVALVAPAPYGGTGLKGLAQLGSTLASLGAVVLPYPIAVGEALLVNDELQDEAIKKRVEELGATLAKFSERLAGIRKQSS